MKNAGMACNHQSCNFSLEVRLFFEWFFRKDYCFSRDLQSTIQGDYSFYGRLDFQGFLFVSNFLTKANLQSETTKQQGSLLPTETMLFF